MSKQPDEIALDSSDIDDRHAEADNAGAVDGDGQKPRMRFKGIVEAGAHEPTTSTDFGILKIEPSSRRWNSLSRQVWLAARLVAILVCVSVLLGVPLGNYWAYYEINGTGAGWNIFEAYDFNVLTSAVIIPLSFLLLGYLLSRMATMLQAAESIAVAAQQMTTPDVTAARNAERVGDVMRGQMTALNQGLDGALTRLASVESIIRQHVEAIEIAGDAIEHKATGAVARVADERSRLMELTESLNAHADSFAAAIAERAQASIVALENAEKAPAKYELEFDERLQKLEGAATRAVTSFESLRDALRSTDESMRGASLLIDQAAEHTLKASERATAASNAAAESAAINAANVAASANRAADAAKEAADKAIATVRDETEQVAQAAIDAAAERSEQVKSAAVKAVGEMSKTTTDTVEKARKDASEAMKAAAEVSEAAKVSSDAAKEASANVTKASEDARKSSDDALKYTETAAARIEERNRALSEARAALEKENERLENLIEEQRKRADRLADAIASQTQRLTALAEAQLREQEAVASLAVQTAAEAKKAEEQKARIAAEQKAKAERLEAERKKAERLQKEQAVNEKKAAEEAARKEAAEKENAARKAAKLEDSGKAQNTSAARLNELAETMASRGSRKQNRKRTEPPVEAKSGAHGDKKLKGDVSWKEILDATDVAEPLDLGRTDKKTPAAARDEAEDAIRIISNLQHFTYDLETRLYGDPPPALQERFERGDRNVFANRLLRLNESDVKRRIRTESARDRKFETSVHDFLQSFEKLLEDATTSDTADEELEEYLSSPLGRVYLLIGATVGYFA
ncbi:MAG: hypothetical protein HKN14_12790 [Marinicaulis sp.]|nr:hypothetical protein [Marinicaulis sp.]